MAPSSVQSEPHLEVNGLSLAFGRTVILEDVSFSIRRGDIFIIMGGSGSGKSTVLKALTGLKPPREGRIVYQGRDLWTCAPAERSRMVRNWGILYQSGALWSSMTLAENVALPLEQFTDRSRQEIKELVAFKLALVGLSDFGGYYPSELSGGMRKRAGLARAIALDPDILFFDEPSAGLDPVSAKHLDDLILELQAGLGSTVVVVTHELASIFAIGTNAAFLDGESRTVLDCGHPRQLLEQTVHPKVRAFLTRDGSGCESEDHTTHSMTQHR
jgi:phospholipid/cholesterol/gamma-HCH transport system ATP-binding protein